MLEMPFFTWFPSTTENFCLVFCYNFWMLTCFRCDMEEKKDEEDSTMNEGEAEVAISHAKRLVNSGVQASDIGIITPYAAQVQQFPCLILNKSILA